MAEFALSIVPATTVGAHGTSTTIGEDERGNAERRAIFIGLWPPMFWLIGDTLRHREQRKRHGLLQRWRRVLAPQSPAV